MQKRRSECKMSVITFIQDFFFIFFINYFTTRYHMCSLSIKTTLIWQKSNTLNFLKIINTCFHFFYITNSNIILRHIMDITEKILFVILCELLHKSPSLQQSLRTQPREVFNWFVQFWKSFLSRQPVEHPLTVEVCKAIALPASDSSIISKYTFWNKDIAVVCKVVYLTYSWFTCCVVKSYHFI